MWRKIRRFYWYRRDRGLGKQTIAMAVMFLLLVIILAGEAFTTPYETSLCQ